MVQDTVANIPSTSGAAMNPVVTNQQGNDVNLMCMQTPSYSPSLDDDITLHVNKNLRQNNHKHDYVDLAFLLHSSVIDHDVTFEQGQLDIDQVSPLPKTTIIETLSDAFLILMGIHCYVHPHKFQELAMYMSSVGKGAIRHGGIGRKTMMNLRESDVYIFLRIHHYLFIIYMDNFCCLGVFFFQNVSVTINGSRHQLSSQLYIERIILVSCVLIFSLCFAGQTLPSQCYVRVLFQTKVFKDISLRLF